MLRWLYTSASDLLAGIVDDIYGASFLHGTVTGNPMDVNGHGTFMSGVIGAMGNSGVSGVNKKTQLDFLSVPGCCRLRVGV